MSRHHRKVLKRGISQPLEERTQRVRASRHNKPHTTRRWSRSMEMVSPGTPGAKRTVEKRDPKMDYPAGTVEIDGMVVVYRKPVDRSAQVQVTEPYKMRVAAGPTQKPWGSNDPKNMAPRGKAGQKSGPGSQPK